MFFMFQKHKNITKPKHLTSGVFAQSNDFIFLKDLNTLRI